MTMVNQGSAEQVLICFEFDFAPAQAMGRKKVKQMFIVVVHAKSLKIYKCSFNDNVAFVE